MKKEDEIRISKFLSLVLRHKPEAISLTLDKCGWASTYELISKVNQNGNGIYIDFDILKEVVETNNKQRFGFNENFTKIKAHQGHSIKELELEFDKEEPPFLLFHGTALRNVENIKKEGLLSMQRHHVHLTSDFHTAYATGKRYGEPIVFTILAGAMYEDGIEFFLSENSVWLVNHVAFKYIIF